MAWFTKAYRPALSVIASVSAHIIARIRGVGNGGQRDGGCQEYSQLLNTKRLVPVCGAVYNLEHIRQAIAAQDAGKANGKIAVKR